VAAPVLKIKLDNYSIVAHIPVAVAPGASTRLFWVSWDTTTPSGDLEIAGELTFDGTNVVVFNGNAIGPGYEIASSRVDWLPMFARHVFAELTQKIGDGPQLRIVMPQGVVLELSGASTHDRLLKRWGSLTKLPGVAKTTKLANMVYEVRAYCTDTADEDWVIATLTSGRSRWEDLPLLKFADGDLVLETYHNQESPQRLRDYQSFAQLQTAMAALTSSAAQPPASVTPADFATYSAAPYATTLWDDANLRVVQLLNITGSRWWSWLWRPRGPRLIPSWCTGWDDTHNWDYHTSQGPLFVVWDKTGVLTGKPAKWQIHVESDQFKDDGDVEVDRTKFLVKPFLDAVEGAGLLKNFADNNFLPNVGDYYQAREVLRNLDKPPVELTGLLDNITRETKPTENRTLLSLFAKMLSSPQPTNPHVMVFAALLGSGNLYATLVTPSLKLNRLQTWITKHAPTSVGAWAEAAIATNTTATLAQWLEPQQFDSHARRLPRITQAHFRQPDWASVVRPWAAMRAVVLNKISVPQLNRLYRGGQLFSIVASMNREEFDLLHNRFMTANSRDLAYDPQSLLFETHRSIWPTAMVAPHVGHDLHYALFGLLGKRVSNLPTFLSKVGKLSPADYFWLVSTWVRLTHAEFLPTLTQLLLRRSVPNVVELVGVLMISANANRHWEEPMQRLVAMLDCYVWPVLDQLLRVIPPRSMLSSVLPGYAKQIPFYQAVIHALATYREIGHVGGAMGTKVAEAKNRVVEQLGSTPLVLSPHAKTLFAPTAFSQMSDATIYGLGPIFRELANRAAHASGLDATRVFAVSLLSHAAPLVSCYETHVIFSSNVAKIFAKKLTVQQRELLDTAENRSLTENFRNYAVLELDKAWGLYDAWFSHKIPKKCSYTSTLGVSELEVSSVSTEYLVREFLMRNDVLPRFFEIAKGFEPYRHGTLVPSMLTYLSKRVGKARLPFLLLYLLVANKFTFNYGTNLPIVYLATHSHVGTHTLAGVVVHKYAGSMREWLSVLDEFVGFLQPQLCLPAIWQFLTLLSVLTYRQGGNLVEETRERLSVGKAPHTLEVCWAVLPSPIKVLIGNANKQQFCQDLWNLTEPLLEKPHAAS